MENALEIANNALMQFRADVFWNWRPGVRATENNICDIVKNLRENGGHRGYQKAAEILYALKIHATTSTPKADPKITAGE